MKFSGTITAVLLILGAASTALGISPSPQAKLECRPAPLWLMSTRGLPCGIPDGELLNSIDYWRHGDNGWEPATSADFRRETDGGQLTFFVHGNWITSSAAFGMGLPVRDALGPTTAAPGDAVVIWSWPSAQDSRRRLADVREKAGRSEAQGRYLAAALDHLPGDRPISLIGYSYGARLVTSALQYRSENSAPATPLAAVLMAAALDDHWLLPGHYQGEALFGVDRLLVLINGQDPVLQRYRFIYGRRSGAQALGFVGLPGCHLPNVEQWWVDGYIGRSHDWTRYVYSCPVAERVREFVQSSVISSQPSAQTTALKTED